MKEEIDELQKRTMQLDRRYYTAEYDHPTWAIIGNYIVDYEDNIWIVEDVCYKLNMVPALISLSVTAGNLCVYVAIFLYVYVAIFSFD